MQLKAVCCEVEKRGVFGVFLSDLKMLRVCEITGWMEGVDGLVGEERLCKWEKYPKTKQTNEKHSAGFAPVELLPVLLLLFSPRLSLSAA